MGSVRMPIAVVFLSAAAVIAASTALAATPQEIYRDYADNGRLDGQYSPADLERVLENAAVQQYGQPSTGGLPPAVEKEIDDPAPAPPPAAAAGGPTASPPGGAAPVQSTGGLPFTGLDLSLIVAGALGLLLLGTALRRVGRQRA
jgi:hypothetical protein